MIQDTSTQPRATPGRFDAQYFETHYRNYASQNPPWKLGFYLRALGRHLPVDQPADVLDIGCGLGAWLGHLSRHTRWRLAGTDVSEWAIEDCGAQLPDVKLSVATATDQPYPTGSLDAVTACDVIEHVPDRDAAGAAIARMLRPGGHFMLVVPVYDGLCGPIIRSMDKDPTHVHKLARRDWLTWIEQNFTVVEWWGILRYLLPGGLYLHLPTRFGRGHTPAILVVARRR
ncbi:MAG: class I SAM-dependent methyltransferase [Candidatus Binatia bacterium]